MFPRWRGVMSVIQDGEYENQDEGKIEGELWRTMMSL